MIFTGFQYNKYWHEEMRRYRKLSAVTHSLFVFAGFPDAETVETEPPNSAESAGEDLEKKLVLVDLNQHDALRQEWFLIVLTDNFSVLLCGLDRQAPVEHEPERIFDTIISFEPAVVNSALDVVAGVLGRYQPEQLERVAGGRQLFQSKIPTPAYLSLFMAQFIEHSNFYRKKNRQLDQERAMRATIARLLHDASQPVTTLSSLLQLSQRLGTIEQEDLDILVETATELVDILNRLREVNKFRTSQYEDIVYLDTGEPLV
jgi:DICT domain-containing protein